MGEFDLIRRCCTRARPSRADVLLGIGDDCALLAPPAGRQLAVSLDLLVSGVHFLADVDPWRLGWKALAVNLSDLAAAGAEPAWVTLGLTLPAADESWLAAFMDGFFALADRYAVQLVGGDTTRGPLAIAVQVHGFVEPGQALIRGGARPGDLLCVSGVPGEAAVGLALRLGRLELPAALAAPCIDHLECPEPRVALGRALRGLASAALDVSDGLAQDLGHLLDASNVGATLDVDALPRSASLQALGAAALEPALAGGDDYELLFTIPPDRRDELTACAAAAGVALTVIGRIEAAAGLRLRHADGRPCFLARSGYDHFA